MAESVHKAAGKYLLNLPEVVAAVGKFTVSQKPFIFRDEILVNLEDGQYVPVSAIVVEDGGPLAISALTRFRARRLRVTIWANGLRDEATGALISPSAVEDKINDTFIILDRYLHRTILEPVVWSTLMTYGSERIGDISEPIAISDGDGIMIATVNYAVYF